MGLFRVLRSAKRIIRISMYRMGYENIIRQLIKSASEGIHIYIITDLTNIADGRDEDRNHSNQIKELLGKVNIHVKYPKPSVADIIKHKFPAKMHNKYALIDNKTIMIGSLNWSHSALNRNYETFIVTENLYLVRNQILDFDKFFKTCVYVSESDLIIQPQQGPPT